MTWKEYVAAVAVGIAFACIAILAVFASGSTFGQRCARMHPGNEAAQVTCADLLERGKAHG